MTEEPKLGEALVKSLVEFPRYAMYYVGGFVVAILTDVSVTTLTAAAVVLGFLTSWLIALGTFFALYLIIRQLDTMNGAIAVGLNAVASQINQHASVVNAWRAETSRDQEHN